MNKSPPNGPLVAPRSSAESEIKALIDEIPTWDDAMLAYMHKRFATSRLFRVHHRPDAPMTERTKLLHAAAGDEMARRGLAPLAPDSDDHRHR